MDATSGAGTAYPSGASEVTPCFSGVRVTRSLVFCVIFVDRFVSFCPFFFWPLCCLFFCLLAIVLSVLLSFGLCVVCSSVFWSLCCLFFDIRILITPLVSSNSFCGCLLIEEDFTSGLFCLIIIYSDSDYAVLLFYLVEQD
jgi:hypothetical protein